MLVSGRAFRCSKVFLPKSFSKVVDVMLLPSIVQKDSWLENFLRLWMYICLMAHSREIFPECEIRDLPNRKMDVLKLSMPKEASTHLEQLFPLMAWNPLGNFASQFQGMESSWKFSCCPLKSSIFAG